MARLQIITVSAIAEITSGCNVQSYQTTCYRNLTWQTKAWHVNTKDREQNSFIELIPKNNRKYGRIHANMANDMTDSYMAGTTISMHVGELEPLTTEQYMVWKGNRRQEDMFMNLSMARASSQGAWITSKAHGKTGLNVNRLTATLFSKFGA